MPLDFPEGLGPLWHTGECEFMIVDLAEGRR
jgi:hypothetical protein